jgi:hypothetical protein
VQFSSNFDAKYFGIPGIAYFILVQSAVLLLKKNKTDSSQKQKYITNKPRTFTGIAQTEPSSNNQKLKVALYCKAYALQYGKGIYRT